MGCSSVEVWDRISLLLQVFRIYLVSQVVDRENSCGSLAHHEVFLFGWI
jgi:hypothetical protein